MPGSLYPADGPRTKCSTAETKVYEALRAGLPANWRAWHSLRLRVGSRWEGEGDFVIASPEHGLLVLEVKGGRIELSGGRWLQNGKALDEPPRDQAHGLAKNLVAEIERRGAARPPYGVACAFPDTEFSEGPQTGDLAGLVIGARELSWIGEVLPAVFDRAIGGRAAPATCGWMDKIHDIWGHTWVPRVSLADRTRDSAERRLALDHEQLAILDYAGGNRRALVQGGAGSGKTVVARELLMRAAREGKSALFLCFTDALGRTVEDGLEEERARGLRVDAAAIRRFAAALVGGSPAPTKAFWDEVSLRAACDALPAVRPDLVVVDEAQDLEANDWCLVEELARDRDLWIFADERQRFWRDRPMPEKLLAGMTRLTLRRQHRNPDVIATLAASYVDPSVPAPTTADPSVLRVAITADPLDRVRHEIDSLRREGAAASGIVVLTLAGQEKSRLLTLGQLGTHRLKRADAPDAASSTVADTFLRFKGLDRPFVIVTELVHGPTMNYATRMHIALTRATVGAVVVCDEDAVARDPHLAALQTAPSPSGSTL